MPSSHQHGISNSATRRKAGRKWRHIANAQVRRVAGGVSRKQKKLAPMKHEKLGQGVQWVDREPITNKLPLEGVNELGSDGKNLV